VSLFRIFQSQDFFPLWPYVCAFKMGNGMMPFPEDNFSTKKITLLMKESKLDKEWFGIPIFDVFPHV
jgi:hypothetical protein